MLHEGSVHTISTMQHQCNVHGAMSTAKVNFDEILCWVDNYRQSYNALPTGNQDIVSSLAQRVAKPRPVVQLISQGSVYSFSISRC